MSKVPWKDHAEYVALHDVVAASIDWAGIKPIKYPHGGQECANMIVVNRRYKEDCPRFGGADTCAESVKRNGTTAVLCGGPRWFVALGKEEPKTAVTFWKATL